MTIITPFTHIKTGHPYLLVSTLPLFLSLAAFFLSPISYPVLIFLSLVPRILKKTSAIVVKVRGDVPSLLILLLMLALHLLSLTMKLAVGNTRRYRNPP